TGWVAQHGEPLLVPDVSRDPRYYQLNPEIRSELAVPLKINGRLIGVVNVDSTRLNAFSEEDLELLTLLSNQSAQVIRNGELYETARRQAEQLSTLIEINKTIASTLSLEKMLREIVERTARLMDAKICAVMLLSEDGEELTLEAWHGGGREYPYRANLRVADSHLGQVIRTGHPLELPDIREVQQFRFRTLAEREGVRALLAMPLIVREKAIGLIKIYKARIYRFPEAEKRLLKTFADLCAIAIENARLYEKMIALEDQTRRAERLAAVGELAAGIAHEIRNPLTIVKMLFDSGGALTEQDRQVIGEELNRMNTIVTHLLDYVRPREPAREPCSVNNSLENALLLMSHELEQKRIRVVRDLEEGLPKILADPVQLQQVFLNLLLNSAEALDDGGEIRLRTRSRSREQVEIVLEDTGPGLPEVVQQNLFAPFITTRPRGLGLGLSIVKRIIDAHRGSIRMENRREGGVAVTIRLPVG
ncbi:MAG: GAF domain-containing protein, partial [Calditrichaeota bacterium]